MALRTFDPVEQEALEQRAHKTWATLRSQGFPPVPLASVLHGFGDWRRVAAPISEPLHRHTCVLFRSTSTNEYAALGLPTPEGDETRVSEAGLPVLVEAARVAAVGDYLQVWQWALSSSPPLTRVAMWFLNRLEDMEEDVRFLAAFSLVEDTRRIVAAPRRSALRPLPHDVRALVDRLLWEAPEPVRARVTEWAVEEVVRFIDRLPAATLASDEDGLRLEVEHLIEVFVEEQHAHDPTGRTRVGFEWDPPTG